MRGPGATKRRLALGLALAAAALSAPPAAAQALEQKLVAADGAPGDELGSSVAIDGDTAVVGAPEDDNGAGAVYVFERAGDSWTQTAKLTAWGFPGDNLGASVAIDGETIVAGAPREDASGNQDQGSVYTFARTGDDHTPTSRLIASEGDPADQLGTSVAIDGETIVAGAPYDYVDGKQGKGSAYTFDSVDVGTHNEIAKLTASDGKHGDHLGDSVAIDGDTIVAGAADHEVQGFFIAGSVYTFARTGDDRTETARLTASDAALGDQLGISVAIDGDTIVAGAFRGGADQGSAYTFARTCAASPCNQTAKLTASDGDPGDGLGLSVAIDGETIVVGAPVPFSGTTGPGSAYIFTRTGPAARTETAKLTAADGAAGDRFGWAAAIDGDTIVAGARFDDVGGNADQGSASILLPRAPAPVPAPAGGRGAGAAPPPVTVPCPEGTSPTVICARDPDGRLRYQGTDADDTFAGTKGEDVMVGEGGSDRMRGRAGDDELRGGAGKDKLEGGGGRDSLKGGAGRDSLKGNGGRDQLSGQGSRDRLKGGGGRDRLRGGKGKDSLSGQGGQDRLKGNSGRDRFSGGAGNDRINSKGQQREKVGCGGGKKDRVKYAKGDRVKRSCERVKR